ncbi:MAG: stage II sporulation protein R [Eubacteriales bacterium]|nr:stage II sporulation protein R [Eubacteriales bacterium]
MKSLSICLLLAAFFWGGALLSDRRSLDKRLIRLHVVANSDSRADQSIKLQVRDAVISGIQSDLAKVADMEQAKAYLQESLPKIQRIANGVLERAGVQPDAVVTLCREAFDRRVYDTFSLPAGVYEALRITIGEGRGHNWWCVAFPTLCLPATTQGFRDAAVEAGFSETMTKTLTGEDYQLRFYLLDALGKLENRIFEHTP